MTRPSLHTGVSRRVLGAGVLGTLLLAVGGVGVGAVPRYKDAVASLLGLQSLHRSFAGRTIALVLVVTGILLVAAAWWRVGQLLHVLTPRNVLVIAGLWSLPLLFAPPMFSRDVYAYAGQGHLVASGVDPYVWGPGYLNDKFSDSVDGVWQWTPSPYGPVFLWVAGRLVALAGNHVIPAIVMLRLLAVAGLLLVAWALPKLARAHGVPAQRALWLGVANPFVLIHGVGGAHNDALMVGLLVAGLAVAGRDPSTRRLVLATAIVSTAALVKVPAAAGLAFLPLTVLGGWRPRLRAAALVGATTAVTTVVLTYASGLGWGWLETLNVGSARLSVFSPVTGAGVLVGNLLTRVGLVDSPGPVLRLFFTGGLVVAGGVAVVLLLRAHKLGPLRALGLTLVAVVALAPVVQPWYLLWGLVLLAAVGGEQVVLALGALSVALCLAVLPNGRSLVRPPLYGLPVLAAGSLAALEVRRSAHRILVRDRMVLVAPTPLVAPSVTSAAP